MAANYRTPPVFSETKPYSRWCEEVKVWQSVTDLKVERQAAAIALSLPENAIRDKVFSELGVEELNRKEGVDSLLGFMDAVYKKDEVSTAYEAFSEFDRYKRDQQTSMEAYLLEFERLYNRTKKYTMSLPEAVLAFRLLDSSGLEHKDRQLVLTGVDYKQETTLFKQMAVSIRKFFGKQSMPVSDTSSIKIEPVFLAEDSEQSAYYTSRNRWNGRGHSGNQWGRRGSGNNFRGESGRGGNRRRNPLGNDGNPLKCHICESILHFARNCPDSYENMNKESEEISLFTTNANMDMQVLLGETVNAAVLDSASSTTVSGSVWMKNYLGALSEEQSQKVITCNSNTVFKFGGGKKLKSIKKVTFPCRFAGQRCTITTDVVNSDIPLLLGKSSMKAAKIVLDLENDRANILGQDVELTCSTSGHYYVPLLDSVSQVEAVVSSAYDIRSREVVVEVESSKPSHQIRSSGITFETSEVYHQQNGLWKGPGKKTIESGELCSIQSAAEDTVFPTVHIEVSEDEQTSTEDIDEKRMQSNNMDLPEVKMNIKFLPTASEDKVPRDPTPEEQIHSDSQTAGKDTLQVVLPINRDIYLQPSVEVDSDSNHCELRKCVYDLNVASHQCCFSVRSELLKSDCVQSVIDPALLYWHSSKIFFKICLCLKYDSCAFQRWYTNLSFKCKWLLSYFWWEMVWRVLHFFGTTTKYRG